jgi:hypothetical protein
MFMEKHSLFYQRRSFFQILKEGTILYFRHIVLMSKPLIIPLLAQLVGIFLWIGLTYGVVDLVTTHFPILNPWLLWGIFLAANLPGLYIFIQGFWHYLVWVSGLNLVARDLVETGQCSDLSAFALRINNRATEFSVIWTFLFAINFLPVGLAVIPLGVGGVHPQWGLSCNLLAGAIFLIGILIVSVLMLFFALVFQTFAFTPGSAGASLFRSVDLVKLNIPKTLGLSIIAVAATQFVLPPMVMAVLDGIRLTSFLGNGLEVLVRYALSKSAVAIESYHSLVLSNVFHQLTHDPRFLSLQMMETLFYTFFSALFLPLGCWWFALLYADLKTQMEENQALQKSAEVLQEV